MIIRFCWLIIAISLNSCGTAVTNIGENFREIIDFSEDQRAKSDQKIIYEEPTPEDEDEDV
jgi:hypothetical protein